MAAQVPPPGAVLCPSGGSMLGQCWAGGAELKLCPKDVFSLLCLSRIRSDSLAPLLCVCSCCGSSSEVMRSRFQLLPGDTKGALCPVVALPCRAAPALWSSQIPKDQSLAGLNPLSVSPGLELFPNSLFPSS